MRAFVLLGDIAPIQGGAMPWILAVVGLAIAYLVIYSAVRNGTLEALKEHTRWANAPPGRRGSGLPAIRAVATVLILGLVAFVVIALNTWR